MVPSEQAPFPKSQNHRGLIYLLKAEELLATGQYKEATEQSGAGLSYALSTLRAAGMIRLNDSSLYWALFPLIDIVTFSAIGLNYAEHFRYTQIAGDISIDWDRKIRSHGMKEPATKQDAEFAVAYCEQTVIEIESRVGSLDAPFGIKHESHEAF